MPDRPIERSQDERRAYREGGIDQRLAAHDEHFRRINGSIDRTAESLVALERSVDKLIDQVQGMAVVMPSIQTVANRAAEEIDQAARVAKTLREKTEADRTTWDRYRGIAAWGLGVLIAVTSLANFTTRLFGTPVKTPAQVETTK